MDMTSFLNGHNATYIAQLYERFLREPGNVDAEWRHFFGGLNDDEAALLAELHGAAWAPNDAAVIGAYGANGHAAPGGAATAYAPAPYAQPMMPADQIRRATLDSIRALMLIRAYRVRGHLEATLDPLGRSKHEPHPELDPRTYGFGDSDQDRPIFINYVLGLESASLRQIMSILRETYCGNIGVEFTHIQDPDEKAWIQERIEGARNQTDFTERGKKAILDRLTAAEVFEHFLDKNTPAPSASGSTAANP
jgi:2-oxoglutarate dehydrogenase E1 component